MAQLLAARSLALAAAGAILCCAVPAPADDTAARTGGAGWPDVGLAASRPSPKLAGARYGQALGASLVCPFVHLLPGADNLMSRYSGADLEAFKAEARQVALVWNKTLACDPTADINRCRVLSEKSCSEAIREIGPGGIAEPGLIEFRKQ